MSLFLFNPPCAAMLRKFIFQVFHINQDLFCSVFLAALFNSRFQESLMKINIKGVAVEI